MGLQVVVNTIFSHLILLYILLFLFFKAHKKLEKDFITLTLMGFTVKDVARHYGVYLNPVNSRDGAFTRHQSKQPAHT